MKLKFWGVRGSIAVPGPTTVAYGGNTSCLELIIDEKLSFIIDCGTGLRELGLVLARQSPLVKNVFITHTHSDHINGIPFFVPCFIKGNHINFYGPASPGDSLKDILYKQMSFSFFPIQMDQLGAEFTFQELTEGERVVEGVTVKTMYTHHSILCMGYRFEYGGKSIVTLYDCEPYSIRAAPEMPNLFGEPSPEEIQEYCDELNGRFAEFAQGADLLIHDSQYTEAEYPNRVGWGHSTFEYCTDLAKKAGVKRLAYFHHEPMRNDEEMARLDQYWQDKAKEMDIQAEVFMAKEGMVVEV